MSVFLYAPGVKVYISTQDNGILDVSDDLTGGSLVRRSDGVSTFSFSLQNAFRKYDGVFTPNDRVIVMMKRISWLQVFTGYLNAVPLVTAWPQVVQINASCSLKRLQYWFWDPGTEAATELVANALTSVKNPDDGGVSNAVLAILNSVVGWPATKVHIAGIPQSWFKWAYKIAQSVEADLAEADALAQQFYATLGGNGSVGGTLQGGVVASNALKAGSYGGITLSKDQAKLAVLIFNTAAAMDLTTQDAMIGIMTAYGESHLTNIMTPNSTGAYGLFQQRPSQGWGSVAQVINPQYAARKFFSAEKTVKNRLKLDPGQVAVKVQRPGVKASYYDQFQTMATQVVNVLYNGIGGTSLGNSPAFQNLNSNWQQGKASGSAILQTAQALVKGHPHIPYNMGNDSVPNTPADKIVQLDCSSLVQWVIFHTFGNLNGCPRVAGDQAAWCQGNGQLITAAQGMNTPGALMYKNKTGGAGIPKVVDTAGVQHTEISVGDGKHTIGAHEPGTYAGQTTSAGYWDFAGLAPKTDYSGTPGTSAGAGVGTLAAGGLQLGTVNEGPWYNPNDPFDKLFGGSPWVVTVDQVDLATSASLTGVRALLNDQPLLPYLSNLLKSTMRSFSSAPNGDFISWFPDYYGLWGTAAIMQIEPIELMDFTVYWDDTNFVTHQYTVAPYSTQALDLQTATIENVGPLNAVTTTGVATIDIPSIMYALFGLEPTKAAAQKFIDYIYSRFGARPDFEQLPGVVGPSGEFFSALFLFMKQWAYQYNADVPLTFMPEIWPGMLIQIPAFGFQAYVTTVTHNFQMGPGGSFSTVVNIAAPARLPGKDGDSSSNLIGLPVAGGLVPPPSMPGSTGGGTGGTGSTGGNGGNAGGGTKK